MSIPALIPAALMPLTLVMMRLGQLKGSNREHLLWKTVSSVLFTVCAVLANFTGRGIGPAFYVFLTGFLLSVAGDVLLALPGEKYFTPGGLCFAFAHAAYTTGIILTYGFSWWALPAAAVPAVLSALYFTFSNSVDISADALLAYTYICIISLMVGSAFTSLISTGITLYTVLLVCGAVLFMVSDIILARAKYSLKSLDMAAANMITYFAGQLLIALSLYR